MFDRRQGIHITMVTRFTLIKLTVDGNSIYSINWNQLLNHFLVTVTTFRSPAIKSEYLMLLKLYTIHNSGCNTSACLNAAAHFAAHEVILLYDKQIQTVNNSKMTISSKSSLV